MAKRDKAPTEGEDAKAQGDSAATSVRDEEPDDTPTEDDAPAVDEAADDTEELDDEDDFEDDAPAEEDEDAEDEDAEDEDDAPEEVEFTELRGSGPKVKVRMTKGAPITRADLRAGGRPAGPSVAAATKVEFTPHKLAPRERQRMPKATSRRAARVRAILIAAVVILVVIVAAVLFEVLRPSHAVAVSGKFGTSPKVSFPNFAPPTKAVTDDVITGHGAMVSKGDLEIVDLVAYSWSGKKSDKKTALDSYAKDQVPLTWTYGKLTALTQLDKATQGKKVGSRVVVTIPSSKINSNVSQELSLKSGSALVLVADIKGVYPKTTVVTGTPAKPKTGMPTVTESKTPSAAPTITLPKSSPSKSLQTQTLIQGTGPVVKKGQLIVTQYTGVNWRTAKVFDSSWKDGALAAFQIGMGAVIPGWDKGLVGQRVGSQVLLTIPPSDGYGSSGQSSVGIKGTDTLVFVVDILGAY